MYNPTELIVQIPRPIYLNTPTSDSSVLYTRIHKSQVLENDWSLETQESSPEIILKNSSLQMIVTIKSDCLWSVNVRGHLLQLSHVLDFSHETIKSVNVLLKLLENLHKGHFVLEVQTQSFFKLESGVMESL
jgi:hypothetical protein